MADTSKPHDPPHKAAPPHDLPSHGALDPAHPHDSLHPNAAPRKAHPHAHAGIDVDSIVTPRNSPGRLFRVTDLGEDAGRRFACVKDEPDVKGAGHHGSFHLDELMIAPVKLLAAEKAHADAIRAAAEAKVFQAEAIRAGLTPAERLEAEKAVAKAEADRIKAADAATKASAAAAAEKPVPPQTHAENERDRAAGEKTAAERVAADKVTADRITAADEKAEAAAEKAEKLAMDKANAATAHHPPGKKSDR